MVVDVFNCFCCCTFRSYLFIYLLLLQNFSYIKKSISSLGVVRNFRKFLKSLFPTKRGEGVLTKYELEKV